MPTFWGESRDFQGPVPRARLNLKSLGPRDVLGVFPRVSGVFVVDFDVFLKKYFFKFSKKI